MSKHAVLALLLMFASPAALQAQQQSTQPQPPAAEPKKNPLDKVVCKTEDTMGTRLGAHRVCATVREWQEQALENQQATEKMQGMPNIPSN